MPDFHESKANKSRVDSLRLFIVTSRPFIEPLFIGLKQFGSYSFEFECASVSADIVSELTRRKSLPEIALIDAAPDPMEAIKISRNLKDAYPNLPLLTLVTCPRSLGMLHLQALICAGTNGIVGSSIKPQELLSAIERTIHGHLVIQIEDRGLPMRLETLARREASDANAVMLEVDAKLFELVAKGYSDEQIGQELLVSVPTLRRKIDRLKKATGTKNRIELAACAGLQGFYSPTSVLT